MTALDDGLNTSAPLFNPPTVTAEWLDLPAGYAANVTVDSVQELGEQIGPQGVEISHSLDDGLPDPVTMTSGNDASGSLSGDLLGRHGVEVSASSLGWTATNGSGTGTGTSIAVTLPTDIAFMDYCMVAITLASDDVVTETTVEPGAAGSWTLLGDISDTSGTTYRTWVFGRQHFTGAIAPVFSITASAAWGYVSAAAKSGRTLGGAFVAVTPERAEVVAEGAGAVTAHTGPAVTLPALGYTVGVFGTGSGAGPWTATGGGTSLGSVNTGVALMMHRSALQTITPRSYTPTANTTISTAVAAMVTIPLVVRERPFLDAQGYFSPFNEQSPVYGFERDTAPITAAVNVVTPEGNVATSIFNGIMNDIPISGRTANLDASSATRLKLDRAVTIPTVNGYREGCDTDWLIGYMLASGGQYTGVCPGPLTRYWNPLHGSLHPYMDGPACFPVSTLYTTARTPGTPYRNNDLFSVDGPFVSGMYAQQKNAEVIQNTLTPDISWATKVPGVDDPLTYDIHSKQNSAGRLSFRIRGDAADVAPAALGGADDWLFAFTLYNFTSAGGAGNYTRFEINSDRTYTLWVGDSQSYTGSFNLPTDDAWHFMGFAWNYELGQAKLRRDGLGTLSFTGFSGNLAELPNTMADLYAHDLFTTFLIETRLPLSEVQLEFGPEVWTTQPFTPSGGGWQWMGTGVNPGSNSLNATFRPTRQPLAGVAVGAPVQGWPVLQSLAESTLSHLRVNEEDNAEFLPLSYFGETAQMTVSTANIFDTSINAADLGITADASKTRNQVTTEFQEVRVASSRSIIFETNAVLTIPRGESFQTFALDKQTVETHGAAFWQSTTPDIVKLTSGQISAPATIPNEHVMTVNFLADGTGTVVASTVIKARIISWDNSTVTIRFRNNWPAVLYLANNGNSVPTLRILGYELEKVDAYATVTDPGSVGLRRERSLTTGLEWIHDRATGLDVTTKLVSILSRPRPQVAVTVTGDPRRRPGMLVSLVDASGTQADGTWRILAIKHKITGAMYVNDLELVRVGEIGIWDESLWDQAVWGE